MRCGIPTQCKFSSDPAKGGPFQVNVEHDKAVGAMGLPSDTGTTMIMMYRKEGLQLPRGLDITSNGGPWAYQDVFAGPSGKLQNVPDFPSWNQYVPKATVVEAAATEAQLDKPLLDRACIAAGSALDLGKYLCAKVGLCLQHVCTAALHVRPVGPTPSSRAPANPRRACMRALRNR